MCSALECDSLIMVVYFHFLFAPVVFHFNRCCISKKKLEGLDDVMIENGDWNGIDNFALWSPSLSHPTH